MKKGSGIAGTIGLLRKQVLYYSMLLMMPALIFSRALLSICMISFIVASFFHPAPKQQFRKFFASPVLWGMSLLFFIPFITGLWSEDKNSWLGIMVIKLPLFLMPLAFAGPFDFSGKEWERLAILFLLVVCGSSVWSMYYYINDMQAVHEGYLRAKSIITPLENDHVRFSWLLSLAAMLSVWLGWEKRKKAVWIPGLLFFAALWLIIFLHILAARTGLLSFYISAGIFIAWLIIFSQWGIGKKSKSQHGKFRLLITSGFIFIVMLLPVAAYTFLPTFHNRVKYFLYDLNFFKKANYLPGGNDAVRVISLKAGWELLQQNPAKGLGFGDIRPSTLQWYDQHYPGMKEGDRIDPSSDWLMYGTGAGWAGLLLFIFIMIIPYIYRPVNNLLWLLLNITAAASLLFDIGLEVQFGVFIYSFMILWWWKWLPAKTGEPEKIN